MLSIPKDFLTYTVIDVETPNRANNSICQLGLIRVEKGAVVCEQQWLIDPQTEFDYVNIGIHHITKDMVRGQPTFVEIWPQISRFFTNGLIVGHNVVFDLRVIQQCLLAANLPVTDFYYICTLLQSRKHFSLPNHALPAICEHLRIALIDHHTALNDARAAQCVYAALLNSGYIDDTSVQALLGASVEKIPAYQLNVEYSDVTKNIQTLKEILETIESDKAISPEELRLLFVWLQANQTLLGNYPYDVLMQSITDIYADGVVEQRELQNLLEIVQRFLHPTGAIHNNSVDFSQKNVCLTGEFKRGSKEDVAKWFLAKGAVMQTAVNKKTEFVVVGEVGDKRWSFGNFGTKVKKAMELNEKGLQIAILGESDIQW